MVLQRMSDTFPGIEIERLTPRADGVTMKTAQSDGQAWLTPEVRALLRAIPGPHHEKKVVTVIRIAFAMANQEPIKAVFNQPETCAENIWYQKWRHDSMIAAALAATYQRARDYADEETIRQEEFYRRRAETSHGAIRAQAPAALAAVMAGQIKGQRPDQCRGDVGAIG